MTKPKPDWWVDLDQLITPFWQSLVDRLETASPAYAHGIRRFSGWPKRLDREIGWDEETGQIWAGAQTAFYGPEPVPAPCPTDGYQRDHFVPWEGALRSGLVFASSKDRRRFFYYTQNIYILDAHTNDEKSDKGPDEWRPANENVWAQYAALWTNIKHRWSLTATPAEKAALIEMLRTDVR